MLDTLIILVQAALLLWIIWDQHQLQKQIDKLKVAVCNLSDGLAP